MKTTTTKPVPLKPEQLRHVSGAGTPIKERPAAWGHADSGLPKIING